MSCRAARRALVAPVPGTPETALPVQTPAPGAPPAAPEPLRKKGVGLVCPKCGKTDTRVTQTRRYPDFLEKRLRYCRCACGHTFKA